MEPRPDTESELLERLRSAPPESLSDEEAPAVRTLLLESPSARAAVIADEGLRYAASQVLARAGWSLDEILAAAPPAPPPRPAAVWSAALVFLVLGVVLGAGVAAVRYSDGLGRWMDRWLAQRLAEQVASSPAAMDDAVPPGEPSSRPEELPAAAAPVEEAAPAALEPLAESEAVERADPRQERMLREGLATPPQATPPASAAPPEEAAGDHPFLVKLSKSGFGLMAALTAALSDGAVADACRLLVEAEPDEEFGLLPDLSQPGLYTAYPVFLQRFLEEHPDREPWVRQEAGALGELRVGAAIHDQNAVAVEAAAQRFPGTEAAATAYRWLGDRMLAAGDTLRAMGYYKRLLACCRTTDRPQGAARQRLAAALAGQDGGTAPTAAFEYAGWQLRSADYERLVAELRAGAAARSAPRGGVLAAALPAAPPFAPLVLKRWAELSVGDALLRDQREKHSDIDWVARTLGSAATDKLLVVSTPWEIVALRRENGKPQWTQAFSPAASYSPIWDGTACQPLVVGERVFVRHLPKSAPRLYGLDIAKGQVLWESETGLYVVCDPLWDQERLVALTLEVESGSRERAKYYPKDAWRRSRKSKPPLLLQLTSFAADTGAVIAQLPLLRFQDLWRSAIPCRATWIDDRLVATLGGVTFCADIAGRVAWVRRQAWKPADEDRSQLRMHPPDPLIAGGRVVVAQPGVRGICCLELATGGLVWERELPDLRRIVGLARDRLIVQTEQELAGLSLDSGGNTWTRGVEYPLEAFLCGGPGGVVVAQCTRIDESRWQPVLVWLDPDSGQITGQVPLEELTPPHRGPAGMRPRLGPFLTLGDQLLVAQADAEPRPKSRRLWTVAAASP